MKHSVASQWCALGLFLMQKMHPDLQKSGVNIRKYLGISSHGLVLLCWCNKTPAVNKHGRMTHSNNV